MRLKVRAARSSSCAPSCRAGGGRRHGRWWCCCRGTGYRRPRSPSRLPAPVMPASAERRCGRRLCGPGSPPGRPGAGSRRAGAGSPRPAPSAQPAARLDTCPRITLVPGLAADLHDFVLGVHADRV